MRWDSHLLEAYVWTFNCYFEIKVVETRAMEAEDMTVDLEDMDMDMGGPETIVAGGYWETGIPLVLVFLIIQEPNIQFCIMWLGYIKDILPNMWGALGLLSITTKSYLYCECTIMKLACIVFNVTVCCVEYIPVKLFHFFPEARVVMTATQEEITETIMTTEMGHAHIM